MKKKLPLKLLPLLITVSSCGPYAPKVTDCGIDGPARILHCSDGMNDDDIKIIKADKYICQSNPNFKLSKSYIIALEEQLAKCSPGVLPKPRVVDCTIDGPLEVLYCSYGSIVVEVKFSDADNYICVSSTDFQLLQDYRNKLLVDISQCKH